MKLPIKLPYFFFGVIFMLGIFVLVQCNKDEDSLFDEYKGSELKLEIDYKAIFKAGDEVESLMKKGDQESLTELFFDDSKTVDSPPFQYTDEEFETITKAFKKRKLTSVSDDFAEYTYAIDGENYTLTMGLDSDNEWKIIRF